MARILDSRLTTRSDLAAAERLLTEGMRKSASALSAASDLFLSHSRRDVGSVTNGATAILSRRGASVYASYLDPEVASQDPKNFGTFFSSAIVDTKRLVVLLTPEATKSRWVPWELGFAHAHFGRPRVAIWPVVDDPSAPNTWSNMDYLSVYPCIKLCHLDGAVNYTYCVVDPTDNRGWILQEWLRI